MLHAFVTEAHIVERPSNFALRLPDSLKLLVVYENDFREYGTISRENLGKGIYKFNQTIPIPIRRTKSIDTKHFLDFTLFEIQANEDLRKLGAGTVAVNVTDDVLSKTVVLHDDRKELAGKLLISVYFSDSKVPIGDSSLLTHKPVDSKGKEKEYSFLLSRKLRRSQTAEDPVTYDDQVEGRLHDDAQWYIQNGIKTLSGKPRASSAPTRRTTASMLKHDQTPTSRRTAYAPNKSPGTAQNVHEAPKVRKTAMTVGYVKNTWPEANDAAMEKKMFRLQLASERKMQTLKEIAEEVRKKNSPTKDPFFKEQDEKQQVKAKQMRKRLTKEVSSNENELKQLQSQLSVLKMQNALAHSGPTRPRPIIEFSAMLKKKPHDEAIAIDLSKTLRRSAPASSFLAKHTTPVRKAAVPVTTTGTTNHTATAPTTATAMSKRRHNTTNTKPKDNPPSPLSPLLMRTSGYDHHRHSDMMKKLDTPVLLTAHSAGASSHKKAASKASKAWRPNTNSSSGNGKAGTSIMSVTVRSNNVSNIRTTNSNHKLATTTTTKMKQKRRQKRNHSDSMVTGGMAGYTSRSLPGYLHSDEDDDQAMEDGYNERRSYRQQQQYQQRRSDPGAASSSVLIDETKGYHYDHHDNDEEQKLEQSSFDRRDLDTSYDLPGFLQTMLHPEGLQPQSQAIRQVEESPPAPTLTKDERYEFTVASSTQNRSNKKAMDRIAKNQQYQPQPPAESNEANKKEDQNNMHHLHAASDDDTVDRTNGSTYHPVSMGPANQSRNSNGQSPKTTANKNKLLERLERNKQVTASLNQVSTSNEAQQVDIKATTANADSLLNDFEKANYTFSKRKPTTPMNDTIVAHFERNKLYSSSTAEAAQAEEEVALNTSTATNRTTPGRATKEAKGKIKEEWKDIQQNIDDLERRVKASQREATESNKNNTMRANSNSNKKKSPRPVSAKGRLRPSPSSPAHKPDYAAEEDESIIHKGKAVDASLDQDDPNDDNEDEILLTNEKFRQFLDDEDDDDVDFRQMQQAAQSSFSD